MIDQGSLLLGPGWFLIESVCAEVLLYRTKNRDEFGIRICGACGGLRLCGAQVKERIEVGEFKEFAGKAVVRKVGEIYFSILKLKFIHLDELVYTVQKENEERRERLLSKTRHIVIYNNVNSHIVGTYLDCGTYRSYGHSRPIP